MEEATAQIYTDRADMWERRRPPEDPHDARGLATRVRPRGLRVDLGCGPGFHLPELGRPAVGLDVAFPMLELARARAPESELVQADLEALPFRRASIAGVWAAKSYLHVSRSVLPLALAQLHDATEVGAPVDLLVRAGHDEGYQDSGDFPGRFIAEWEPAHLRDVLEGAGFAIDALEVDSGWIRALGSRLRSLPDIVAPGMRLLACGLNPSEYAADAGVGFARPGNRFWPAALRAGLVPVDRDPRAALRAGVGMTDLVKRATSRADMLDVGEYRAGVDRVERLVRWLRPDVVCFVGLAGWRATMDRTAKPGIVGPFGGRPAYLMPSTSGANASSSLGDLSGHLRAAGALSMITRG